MGAPPPSSSSSSSSSLPLCQALALRAQFLTLLLYCAFLPWLTINDRPHCECTYSSVYIRPNEGTTPLSLNIGSYDGANICVRASNLELGSAQSCNFPPSAKQQQQQQAAAAQEQQQKRMEV
eukprot:COSAG06_NODE_6183_length_3061_cov_28.370570_1_plen_122_part_00